MSLPKPEPGLVIRYAYLWFVEHLRGREEGAKDRPCAIVLATRDEAEKAFASLSFPSPIRRPATWTRRWKFLANVKQRLGLDAERSFAVLGESNEFLWPGPDLRRIGEHGDASVAYGFLPPKFFLELKRRFAALERTRRSRRVTRTE